MADIDEHGRPHPAEHADELTSLTEFLDFQRATFEWRTGGLDAAALDRTVAASTMTLGGMLKHLAFVEDWWFSYWLHGNPLSPPWNAIDWDADQDWDWHSAAQDSPEQLRALWQRHVERSRRLAAEAVAARGLDAAALRSSNQGRAPSLRWILLHMIEEYARHNGHADLIREGIDGQTGE